MNSGEFEEPQERTGASDTHAGAPSAQVRRSHSGDDHCVFDCGGQVFAASLSAIREVLTGKLATPIPQAPTLLVGVVELRGDVLPAIQLSVLLGMPARSYTPAHQILVLSSNETQLGLVVDRVRSVRAIDPAQIVAGANGALPAQLARGSWASTAGPVTVLDPDQLVALARRIVSFHLQHTQSGRHAQPSWAGGPTSPGSPSGNR